MTIDSYILLAIFMSLTVGLILIIQKIEQFILKLEALSDQIKNSNTQIKNSTTQINDEIRAVTEAEVKSYGALFEIISKHKESIDSYKASSDALAGSIKDLNAAITESTKL
jgi:methyl-accepting chemotaxis protein